MRAVQTPEESPSSRPLELEQIEDRVLLSASPVAVVMDAAAPDTSAGPMDTFDSASLSTGQSSSDTASTNATDVDAVIAETDQQAVGQDSSTNREAEVGDLSTSSSDQTIRHELVFVDTGVDDYQQLLDDLWSNDDPTREFEVVLLQNSRDGIEQITEALAGRTGIDAVHIVSHGTDTAVKLGSTWLTQDNLSGYAGEIAGWANSLSTDADLLFYGCDLAASSDGRLLVDSISTLTGADVAASTDDTGHAIFGADWDFEYSTGQIETSVAFSHDAQDNWGHVMNVAVDATSTGTTTGSSVTVSHTTTSASNRLMLVGVSIGEDAPPSVSSVTYNGSGLTSEGFVQSAVGGTVEIFSLLAPASGTHDVVVTLSGNGDANVGVMTFSGVDQSTPLGTFASASGDSTSGSVAVSSASDELVFGVVTVNTGDENLVPGGGQTERWDLFSGVESNGGGSTEAGAASVDMSWSWVDSTGWAIGGISIKPASVPTITAIADQTSLENTATGAIAFTVGATNTQILPALTSAMQGNVLDAQGSLSLLSPDFVLPPGDIATDVTFTAGVHEVTGLLSVTAGVTITLDAANQDGAEFIFNISNYLSFGADVNVVVINGTSNTRVIWNATGGYISVGAGANIIGTLMANDYVTTGIDSIVTGAVYSATSSVSLGAGATVGTAAWSLIVTATSDDQTLVPDANITLGGSGVNRTIDILPGLNQTGGPATITVTVDDGSTTTQTTFDVTVTADNAPTITAIADQTPLEDTPTGAIAFTVGDVETAAGSLIVTATSDDQTLVPDANITLGGSGASRTINVLPGLNQTGGPATITVTVDDGATTTQTTFDVTVTPDNDAPTITAIADQTPLEDTATGAIAFTVGDVETAASSLIVTATSDDQTLVPDANITLGGSGASRTIAVLPGTNHNGGPATITVTVDDGTTTTQTTFDVTVTPQNDAPVSVVVSNFTAIDEDDFTSAGKLVSAFTTTTSDVDSGSVKGVAVINVDNTNGSWEYTLDGSNWFAIGNVTESMARLLPSDATARVRFVPDPNYNGVASPFTVVAWDQTSGVAGGLADASTRGGITAFSTASASVGQLVNPINDEPTITSNGGGAAAAVNVAENTTAVTTVTSTDIDGGTPSYSISGGADAAKFAINSSTGELTFAVAPDFETPTDVGTDNIYDVTVQVSDGSLTDTQAVSVTVTSLNDNTPTITSNGGGAAAAVNVAENSTAVTTVTATDADLPADTLTYSISGGADAAKFAINSSTGDLTFAVAPDFETPTDVGTDNIYDVTVQVSDGSLTDTQAISVTVTSLNDNTPTIASNGGGASAAVNVAENSTAVTTVTATDADLPADTLTYSISGGADAAKFAINGSTGELTFAVAPDFETPTDVGTDNIYDVTVQVSDGSLTDTQAISVTVTSLNDNTPTITSDGGGASATVYVAENSTAVTTVTATDADLPADTLAYSISGGADAAKFAINGSTGELTFTVAPDFETPTDVGADNIYDVTVQVSDGSLTDTQAISVTVTSLNDNTPTITSNGGGAAAAVNVAENSTAVTTVTATDADLPADTLAYSISGGADAAKFAINSSTGELTFTVAPDFETPTDVGTDNIYDVTVQVSDGSLTDTQAISVTVTSLNDNTPTITSNGGGAAAAINVAENSTAVTTVTATDPDLPGDTLAYSITGGADAAKFAINSSTGELTFAVATDFETPTDVGTDNIYDVTVQVSDGSLTDTQAISVTVTSLNDNTPTITSDGGGASATVNVAENSTAVTTVTATDADLPADTLTYSISGGADAAKFAINSSTGELTFAVAPDFETPTDVGTDNIYDVTVQVSDGSLTDTQAISVTVTSLNDNTPTITSNGAGASAAVNVAENSTAVTTVTATDADLPADTLAYSISGGADAAKFAINGSTGDLTFAVAPDFETPTDVGTDNIYDVTVQVSDGSLTDTQAVSVTVTSLNDNTPTITSNGGGAAAAVNVAENSTAVTTVTATDADLPADTLTYSISGGADAAKFAINSSTGELTFAVAPDFETPTDVGTDNIYDVTVQVSDGTLTDTQAIAVTVTPVNDNTPTITSDGGGATAAVNTAENSSAVTTVTATDADLPAETLTFSITGGADSLDFAINPTSGTMVFLSAPDFETPADADTDNVYEVEVTVSDNNGGTDVQTVFVTVNDVNDNAPIVTASQTFNVSEDAADTTSIGFVTATDVDTIGSLQNWTITGGNADGIFGLNLATGQLTVADNTNLNFEATSAYILNLTVSDGTNTSSVETVSISINDVNDDPTITSANATSAAENQTSVMTVTAADEDLPAQTLTYLLTGGADQARFAIGSSSGVLTFVSSPDFENPVDVGMDNVYDVQVTVSDGVGGSGIQLIAVTVTDANDAPTITSIADQTPLEDTATGAIAITIGDVETAAGSLTVTATSNNQTLVPDANITLGGSGVSRTINVLPGLNQNGGPATITVTVDDGSTTTQTTFDVTVTADNAPTITAIADQTPLEDTPTGAIAFTVGDVETAAGSLIVTATSDDQTLVPDANITLGGSGASRTINVLPGLNQTGGPATITVTVNDGSMTTQTTFDVTVTAVNDAPVNQVPDTQVTDVDVPVTFNATNGNAVAITEVDSAGSPIAVSLTGYNGTLTLSGTTNLTFNAGDGTADASMQFEGTVADINAALDGLVFTPTVSFEGAAAFTIGTDDQGNTGLGGVQEDKDAVFVSVGALTFQQGQNAYTGTEDTELQEALPATSFGNATSISIDLDNGGAESQGLVQFSNLFGSGIGQIPFGSTIDSASLTVYAFDTSDASTTISLHEMLTGWDENSTWTSSTNGLQRDDVEVSSTADSTMMFADFTGPQTFFGLESTMQSWSDGATNNGWAIFSDSTDGWDFYSSEYSIVDRRPALTISFTPPQPSSLDLDANDSSGQTGADFVAAFVEDGGPVAIADVDAVLTDVDSSSMDSLTVTITNLLDGAAESLAADTSGTSITASYDSPTGVLTLSGTDSLAKYQQVLRTVTYDNASQSPDTTSRSITFVANDGYKDSNTATTTISVTGQNDAPTISPSTFALPENSANATPVGTVVFSDPDIGDSRAFVITTGNTGGAFVIDSNGNISVANSAALDFETTPSFSLTVRITDGSGLFDEATVTVNLTDENDNAPVIDSGQSFNVSESAPDTTSVGSVTATDVDTVGTLQNWTITGGNTGGIFAINAASGEITVADNTNLDFETTALYTLTLTVSDGVTTSSSETVTLNVTDENEAPISSISDTDAAVEAVTENQPAASVVGITASADDPDGTDSVSYSLDNDASGRFTIDSVSGVVTTTGSLDAETATSHAITVRATSDDGSSTTQGFVVAVNDLDEFDISAISDTDATLDAVDENSAIGTTVAITAFASDADATTNEILYTLDDDASGQFAIDGSTGIVTVAGAIDREAGATRSITVRATSDDGSTTTQGFVIAINDLDEFDITAIADTDATLDNVDENALVGTTVGITAFASDADATTNGILYTLDDDAGGQFAIDGSTGLVTVAGAIDREAGVTRSITVRATSDDGSTTTQGFVIAVNDLDEFDITAISDTDATLDAVDENALVGTSVGITAFASDADATTNGILYTLDDDASGQFTIDGSTGAVTVASAIDREAGATRNITVRATSDDGSTTTQGFVIAINDLDEFDITAISDTDATLDNVDENALVGTTVGITAFASDADATINGILYTLDDDAGGQFAIDGSTGLVTVAGAIDREAGAIRSLTVRATSDDGSTTTQGFVIAINDLDEFDITAISDTDATLDNVDENALVGTTVGITAFASDGDATTNAILYTLDDDAGGQFAIDGSTGAVTVASAIDREAGATRNITVRATSDDGSTTTQGFVIAINDLDEFDITAISDTDGTLDAVDENAIVGTSVGVVAFASDADATTNGILYTLDDDAAGQFAIDGSTGEVTVAGAIDREAGASRNITVRATSDDGSTTTQGFVIAINDLDEFDTTAISDTNATFDAIDENAAIGTTVGITAFASDADATTNGITYTLDDDAGGQFAIDGSTGIVTVAGVIDREAGATRIITVRATSNDGSTTTQGFTIAINDLNDNAPVIDPGQSFTVAENVANGTSIGTTSASDVDSVGSLQNWTITGGNADGVFAIDATTGEITVADNTNLDFETTNSYTLTLTVGDGVNTSAAEAVSITVTNVNEAPVNSVPGTQTTDEDTPLVFSTGTGNAISIGDVDAAGNVVRVSLSVSNGTLTLGNLTGLVFVSGDGIADASMTVAGTVDDINAALEGLTYDPTLNFNGGDSLTIVTDDLGNTGSGTPLIDTDTVDITVNAVNDAPVAVADSYSVDEGNILNVGAGSGVLTNDTDVENDPLTASLVTGPANGAVVVNLDGSLTYTPDIDFNGVDTFTYAVSDGEFARTETVTITVDAVNDAPVNQIPGLQTVNEDEPLVFSTTNGNAITIGDVDAASGLIGVRLTATNGTISLGSTSGLTFAVGDGLDDVDIVFAATLADANAAVSGLIFLADQDYNGPATIDINVRDMGNSGLGGELVDQDTISIDVVPVNDAPVAANDAFSLNEDETLTVIAVSGVLSNDSDVDGDPLSATVISGPASGALTLDADGAFNYTPDANFFGNDAFTYVTSDGQLDSGIVTVSLAVASVNDAPVTNEDEFEVRQADSLIVTPAGLLDNDSDIEGDTLASVLVSGPANGTLLLDSDGSFEYVPTPTFSGEDSFTYRSNDGLDDGNEVTVTIVVVAARSTDTPDGTPDGGPDDPGPGDIDDPGEEAGEPPTPSVPADTTPSATDPPVTFGQSGETLGLDQETPLLIASTESFDASLGGSIRDEQFLTLGRGRANESVSSFVPSYEATLLDADSDLLVQLMESGYLWESLDNLDRARDEADSVDDFAQQIVVGTTGVVGTSLTVGYVIWLLRGGSLLVGMVSSLTAWTMIDPLPVLESVSETVGLDEDGDSLESLLRGGQET